MTARFERHIRRRPLRMRACGTQGAGLCVRLARPFVPTFADDPAGIDDDAADTRIRRGGEKASLGKAQRLCHELVIGGAEHLNKLEIANSLSDLSPTEGED